MDNGWLLYPRNLAPTPSLFHTSRHETPPVHPPVFLRPNSQLSNHWCGDRGFRDVTRKRRRYAATRMHADESRFRHSRRRSNPNLSGRLDESRTDQCHGFGNRGGQRRIHHVQPDAAAGPGSRTEHGVEHKLHSHGNGMDVWEDQLLQQRIEHHTYAPSFGWRHTQRVRDLEPFECFVWPGGDGNQLHGACRADEPTFFKRDHLEIWDNRYNRQWILGEWTRASFDP